MILAGEAENIFENHRQILSLKQAANILTTQELAKELGELQEKRARPVTVEWPTSRGTVYAEPAENGRRLFSLIHTEHVQAPGNRILQFLGAIVFVCGFVGLFIVMTNDSASHQMTAIRINDVPPFEVTSMDDIKRFGEESRKLPEAERGPYWKKLSEEGRLSQNRIWLGNTGDKGSALQLKDARGRTRMLLMVSADGKAEIQMLDEQGKVSKSITPGSKD